jgi:DNA/RNA endonuclease YhcR with UshA esterase domain
LSVGDQIIISGVGGNYDGQYEVETKTSNGIVAKAKKTVNLSLQDFDSSKYIARVTKKTGSYIERISDSEYNFIYTIPQNLFAGNYTILVKTEYQSTEQLIELNFQVSEEVTSTTYKVDAFKVENSTATLYLTSNHPFVLGDYVSVQGVSSLLDGNYYIQSNSNSDQISYRLSISNIDYNLLSSFGNVSSINNEGISPVLSGPNQPTKISYKPNYNRLQQYSTNSILLVGHADGIELNDVIRINSIQEAVNLLGADGRSPLLRGVFEAYGSGARDIYICASAPMSEYVDFTENRNQQLAHLLSEGATPSKRTFYQKYFERLAATYSVVKYYEFIDMIVPLETSIINTGSVDFVTQLAQYCSEFHNETGFVQIGIIGSRSGGVKDSDIDILESKLIFKTKFTVLDGNKQIVSDSGRFIIPIYGEINFNHTGFPVAYSGTAAAAFAGTMSTTPVYSGIIRKRLPAGYSLYGSNLSPDSLSRLDNLGINTVYRSRRAGRGNPFEVYISNDYTMANKDGVFHKAPQVRLAAMVINEIKSIGYDSIGKFAYETVTAKVRAMLNILVATKAIRDYSLDAYADKYVKGSLIYQITLVSALSLKSIKFSVSAGPGA